MGDKCSIIEIVESFVEAVNSKQEDRIKHFIKNNFSKRKDVLLFGTDIGEMYVGHESILRSIQGKLSFFNEIEVDYSMIKVLKLQDQFVVYIDAITKKIYDDSESRFENYISLSSELSPTDPIDVLKGKLTEINWIYGHFLNLMKTDSQECKENFGLTLFIEVESCGLKIRQMNISLPNKSEYPYVRLIDKSLESRRYEKESKLLRKHSVNKDEPFLSYYNFDFIFQSVHVRELVEKYYDNEFCYINQNSEIISDKEILISELHDFRSRNEDIVFNSEGVIRYESDNYIALSGNGIVKATMSEEDHLKFVASNIELTLKESIEDIKKIHKIRRIISASLKEAAKGEVIENPFRFQCLIDKSSNRFRFMQLSYPGNYTSDDKR